MHKKPQMAITIFRAKPWIIKINGVDIFENMLISDFLKPIMQIYVPPYWGEEGLCLYLLAAGAIR